MMRSAAGLVVLLMSLPLSAGDAPKAAAANQAGRKEPVVVTTDSGLKYVDVVVGTGATPRRGQTCTVHYTGWLDDGRGGRGKKFDSSRDQGKPLSVPVGEGKLIKGWDEGIVGMKVGGKRTLYVPSYLGYGPRGAGDGVIPPNADLIFDVELIWVK